MTAFIMTRDMDLGGFYPDPYPTFEKKTDQDPIFEKTRIQILTNFYLFTTFIFSYTKKVKIIRGKSRKKASPSSSAVFIFAECPWSRPNLEEEKNGLHHNKSRVSAHINFD